MLGGSAISFSACWIAFVASPSDAPGARLNDSVTTGNCPWWFTASEAFMALIRVNAEIGTGAPLVVTDVPFAVGAPAFAVTTLGRM